MIFPPRNSFYSAKALAIYDHFLKQVNVLHQYDYYAITISCNKCREDTSDNRKVYRSILSQLNTMGTAVFELSNKGKFHLHAILPYEPIRLSYPVVRDAKQKYDVHIRYDKLARAKDIIKWICYMSKTERPVPKKPRYRHPDTILASTIPRVEVIFTEKPIYIPGLESNGRVYEINLNIG